LLVILFLDVVCYVVASTFSGRPRVTEQTTFERGDTEAVGDGGALVELHLTDPVRAVAGLGRAQTAAVLARAGVRDGQPFVLGADGSYDVALNRFFRELDGWGVRAANSIAAYARDVMLFCRFLQERRGGKSIWECDGADLRAQVGTVTHGRGSAGVGGDVAAVDRGAGQVGCVGGA
jgi:hypothetical protein